MSQLGSSGLPDHFWICNVELWNAKKIQPGFIDVEVMGGIIRQIVPAGSETKNISPNTPVVQGNKKVLMPSGVDAQVHLRVPGQPHKERPDTGLKAALRGGIGALLTMPNTQPVIDTPEVVRSAQEIVKSAEHSFGVRVYFSAAMTEGQRGEFAVDASSLKNSGVKALTDDGRGVASDAVMQAVFEEAAKSGLPLLQHAETPGHGGVVSASSVQQKLGLPAYPESAETDMVRRDLELLQKFPGVRYHVLHVSLSETVDMVRLAKQRGLKASCEVSPHHLFFSAEDIVAGNTSFKMNPPLRSPKHLAELRGALATGDIDFVATDHAPHEQKGKGEDFRSSFFGTTGLETSLKSLLTLYQGGFLSPQRLVEVFSWAPARFLEIDSEFGELAVGRPLRAILVDVTAPPRPVVLEDLESLSKNNIFLGYPLAGRILLHFNHSGLFRLESV